MAGVSPEPPATFSALTATKSNCSSIRSPGMAFSTIWRPGLPTTSPTRSIRTLWRVFRLFVVQASRLPRK